MLDGDDTDVFLLDDEGSTAKAERPLGLVVPERFTSSEDVSVSEMSYRKSARTGFVLFTTETSEGGDGEAWDDERQAQRWRRIMEWPDNVRMPTIQEAQRWQRWAESTG